MVSDLRSLNPRGLSINSEQHVVQAGDNFQQALSNEALPKSNLDRNYQVALMTADAANVYSMLAVAQGRPMRALYFSRLGVKILHRAWASLHDPKNEPKDSNTSSTSCGKGDDLIASMSSLSISAHAPAPVTLARRKLPTRRRIWSLVPRLFHGLLRLSTLYAHQGLLPEAQYYTEQAQKVAKNVASASYQGRFHARAGHYMVRSGDSESSIIHFDKAEVAHQAHRQDQYYVSFQLFLAEKHTLDRQFRSAESAFAIADTTLEHIMKMFSIPAKLRPSISPTLDFQMANLTLAGAPLPSAKPDQSATRGKKSGATANHSVRVRAKAPPSAFTLLHHRKANLLRQRALTSLHAGNLDRAHELLISTADQIAEPHQLILQTLLEAQLCLRRGLESMASDLNYCVLPESTTSCPSVTPLVQQQVEAPEQKLEKKDQVSRIKRPRSKTTTRTTNAQCQTPGSDFRDLLQQTQDRLSKICTLTTKAASTANAHVLVDVLSRTLMMLSSAGSSTSKSTSHPTSVVFIMGMTSVSFFPSIYDANAP